MMTGTTKPLRVYLERYVTISDQDWAIIGPGFVSIETKVGDLLLTEGQVCKSLWFVEEGLLRFFRWVDGDDITQYFTEAPYVFTSQNSFVNEVPSPEAIEVLQPAIIWRIDRVKAYDLLILPVWSDFVRSLVQEVQGYTEAEYLAVRSQTPTQRYLSLMAEHPTWLQQVPLKHIATYLGIAPQSLSRIRAKLAKRS